MTQDEFIKDFAFSLKTMLRIYDISQAKLAKLTNIDKGTISRYCKGEIMPTLKNVLNIAAVIGCELDELVTTHEFIY